MKQNLIKRFMQFSIETVELIQELSKNAVNHSCSGQLIRSSSSAGANYRASQRAKSTKDFINKLKIVEEESDESIYFLDLLMYFNKSFENRFEKLIAEGNELLAITVASLKTARKNLKESKIKERNINTGI